MSSIDAAAPERRRVALVTGGARGLGAALTSALLQDGYVVHVGCRDPEAARSRLQGSNFMTAGDMDIRHLDLASLRQIRSFASDMRAERTRYDLIVNNAGVCNWNLKHTVDGFEETLAVNYLGPYLLTRLLLADCPLGASCGVINIGSSQVASELDLEMVTGASYDMAKSYALSKTLLLAFTGGLAANASNSRSRFLCIHPGLLRTSLGGASALARLGQVIAYPFAANPTRGAQRVMHILNSSAFENSSGGYFLVDEQVAYPWCIRTAETRTRIWNWTSKLVGLSQIF